MIILDFLLLIFQIKTLDKTDALNKNIMYNTIYNIYIKRIDFSDFVLREFRYLSKYNTKTLVFFELF